MSKQKDLFGKEIKEQPSKEKEPRQPEECKICRHCGYIPTYNDFYCWTLEGLCTDVLDYCKENRCYEPSIDKLDIIDILGRKFKRIESDKKNFVRKGIAELELEKAMGCQECYSNERNEKGLPICPECEKEIKEGDKFYLDAEGPAFSKNIKFLSELEGIFIYHHECLCIEEQEEDDNLIKNELKKYQKQKGISRNHE